MPWIGKVAAVLQMWYPGDALGAAAADLLFGDTEPSGRLPVTFPAEESQGPGTTPATYPGVVDDAGMIEAVCFAEGIDVGYRFYARHRQRPLFAFGFGLSYTAFKWTGFRIDPDTDDGATVGVTVRNTGQRDGIDTIEVYAAMPTGSADTAMQLKGFAKVSLGPGAVENVTVKLRADAFAYWNETDHAWRSAPGDWQIMIGRSSGDIVYRKDLAIAGR
jgi:beta-glucosidase